MDAVPFLPFGPITLFGEIPKGYKRNPVTLGEHLKKRRLEANMMQKEAAAELLVNEWTYSNWEKDQTTTEIRYMPRLIEWLGYDPNPPPKNSSEWLMAVRRNLGLSRKRLAKLLGADESTVRQWEERTGPPAHRVPAIRQLY
jgi:DNA-binding XRE family transcriptional regulator